MTGPDRITELHTRADRRPDRLRKGGVFLGAVIGVANPPPSEGTYVRTVVVYVRTYVRTLFDKPAALSGFLPNL